MRDEEDAFIHPSSLRPHPSNDRLALARAGDLHLVAVLRDGAARQPDALPGENLDDLVFRLFGRPVAAEERLHVAANAQARAAVVCEVNLILVVNLLDEDFGHDEYRLFRRVAPARVRVELAYVLKLLDEFFNFHADLLGEVRELVLLQLRKRVLADEARGHAVLSAARTLFAALHFELHEQALARVARAAAYGVEVQDDSSRLLDQFGRPAAERGAL